MSQLHILIIEDEPGIVRVLEPTLTANGANVKIAWSGAQGLNHLKQGGFDAVICDLGLPDIDGLSLLPQIREASDVPIIVLSAREGEQDKIAALDAGADDFVAKPFAAGELLARIRAAVRRRSPAPVSKSMKVGELEIDFERRRVVLSGEEIRLSAREHALLTLLARSPNRIASHKQIIESVWGAGAKAETQSVRVLVGQVRQKIEADPSQPELLRTEPGIGYRLA